MDDRLIRCHLIVRMLVADGIISPSERAFLNDMMAANQLTDSEREQVVNFEGCDEALEHARHLPDTTREELLEQVATAVLSDGGRLGPQVMQAFLELKRALTNVERAA